MADRPTPRQTAEYLEDRAEELARMAVDIKLGFLAHLFKLAALEASQVARRERMH